MSGSDGMDCNELVELVTDYLDDALTDGQRQAFEAHLTECDGCENYVNQMRKTVHLTGSLSVDDIEPDVFDSLLTAFRSFQRDPGD